MLGNRLYCLQVLFVLGELRCRQYMNLRSQLQVNFCMKSMFIGVCGTYTLSSIFSPMVCISRSNQLTAQTQINLSFAHSLHLPVNSCSVTWPAENTVSVISSFLLVILPSAGQTVPFCTLFQVSYLCWQVALLYFAGYWLTGSSPVYQDRLP